MAHESTLHYDQEVDFFRRFLDPYMKYTSALLPEGGDDLDAGAVRMLDLLIASAALPPGARVLDVGCGWGSLLKRLREVRPDVRYTGINPSPVQQAYVAREVDPRAELLTAPFEDVMDGLPGPYDAIFFIGCLCHMTDKARALAGLATLLAEDGTAVLEDTFFLSEALHQAHRDRPETRFVQRRVFGFAEIHSLARHLDTLQEAGLRMISTRDLSDDYARTIAIWMKRLRAVDPASHPLVNDFLQYLEIFQRGWCHTITEHLMTLKKLGPRRVRAA